MTNKKLMTLLTTLIAFAVPGNAQLVINELMQSNIDCIMDDLNEFPDSWVELYNTSSSDLLLSTYKIGLTDNPDEAWQLPQIRIKPQEYAIIYCDKEAKEMHTDFRLESGKGGSVYLFHHDKVEDKVTDMKKQPAPNIAYGRKTDGSDEWGYQQTPTPDAANCGQLCSEILGEPTFSHPGMVMTDQSSISLTLSLPEDAPKQAKIMYTLDGSEPTERSSVYSTPIKISSNQVVRAKLFCDGYLSPRATSHSYIFFDRELTLPVVSMITDDRYLYDDEIGIYVEGNRRDGKRNFEHNWRRPINLEYFANGDEESAFSQLCETRIQGGATRFKRVKSFALYAHKRFGVKRFYYEFFPDQRPGQEDYKSLLLRNAGNDFEYLYMRDAIMQRTVASRVDLDWQAWSPVIIYINGEYKGILNIRERSTSDNIYTNHNGLEDIDMIENWWDVKEGDLDNFERFKEFYSEHGHTLAEYEQWIDWKEFINFMALNLYYNNQDFPANNFIMWRPRAAGGKWRFLVKDTDFGMGLYESPYNCKTIKWFYDNSYDPDRSWGNTYDATRLFRRMMEDEDFRREFIDRTAVYMGDFLNSRGTRAVWDPMYELIKTEFPYHRKIIKTDWPNYNDELNIARSWIIRRTDEFYKQLAEFYDLGTPTTLKVNSSLSKEERQEADIVFNDVRLSEGYFNGKFFANRDIRLTGSPKDGREVVGWKVVQVSSGGSTTTREIKGPEYSFCMPECVSLTIDAILGTVTGIEQPSVRAWSWKMDSDALTLTGIPQGTPVALYDMGGILLQKASTTGDAMTLPVDAQHIYILKVGGESVKIGR